MFLSKGKEYRPGGDPHSYLSCIYEKIDFFNFNIDQFLFPFRYFNL